MAECKLNYTADEINKKLGEVADQVFDSESENAQSGIALKDLVIKELVGDPNLTITYFYLQELKSGIYRAKVTSTHANARIVVRAGTENTVNMRNGGILIVGNDYTINDDISFLTKGFMWVSNTAPRVGFVRTGKLTCKLETILDENDEPILDEEGNEMKEWTYTLTSGDILNSNDKTNTINDDTDTSKIPTVNAVMNYIDDITDGIANNVKLSNRQYTTIQEYIIEEDGITKYSLKGQNLDSAVILVMFPVSEEIYDCDLLVSFKSLESEHSGASVRHNVGQTEVNTTWGNALGAKVDALVYTYSFVSNMNDSNPITDIGFLKTNTWSGGTSEPVIFTDAYRYITLIQLEENTGKAFPIGTKIIVKGLQR